MTKKPRLCFLLNSLAPYGAETFVMRHACSVNRARFDVLVCQLGGSRALAPRLADAGVEVVDLQARGRLDARALARLTLLLARRVDVLQAHIGYATVVGRALGRVVGVPAVVATEQSVRDDRDYRPALRHAMDATFRLAHRNVFISDAVRRSFAARFPDRAGPDAAIITNGIDARALASLARASRAEVRAELGLGETDFAFANVARLTERKGQRFAIDALASLPANARLFLVGKGEDEAGMRAHAAARGVAERVTLLGQRLDVTRLLGGFDAYLHPALVEGLGIAVLEAMAAGLPTVASRAGGIPEYVHDGVTGWLVAPGDAAALAAHMTRVMQRRPDDAAVARAGQQVVFDRHDIAPAAAAYQRIYDELLG